MKLNTFASLSIADQRYIIALCQNNTYSDVVAILARPKPEGLAFLTTVEALCRFYTDFNPLAIEARLAEQLGKTLRIQRQATPGAALTGILAVIENQVLLQLNRGTAPLDLEPTIKLMIRVHRAYIAEETLYRKCKHWEHKTDYFNHEELIEQLADQPDFTPIAASDSTPSTPSTPSTESTDSIPCTESTTPSNIEPFPAPTTDSHSTSFRNDPSITPEIPQIPLKNKSITMERMIEKVTHYINTHPDHPLHPSNKKQ
jgi:hypothetical protein